jgi:hypothetical protein
VFSNKFGAIVQAIVDLLMMVTAHHNCLALSGYHKPDPGRFIPPLPRFIQILQGFNMMSFNRLLLTKFKYCSALSIPLFPYNIDLSLTCSPLPCVTALPPPW